MANTPYQPHLSDLAARYMKEQANAHDAGLGRQDGAGEVVLFEAGPVQTIDPKPAWREALAVLPHFSAGQPVDVQPPSFWGSLVAAQEPAVAVAFCVGNYPQLMRDWQTLVRAEDLRKLCPATAAPLPLSLQEWVGPIKSAKRFPEALLAVGCLRLARQHDAAADFVKALDNSVPKSWEAAWANEKAALAWHSGQHNEALEAWKKQEPSVPVLFNRGMAALFLGKKKDAEAALLEASARLPETSGWHHLGQLYLTFARLA